MRYLLVDRIGEAQPGAPMTGWKNVAMSEDYLEWHFPEQPIMPGVLVLEAMVQLAGWHEASVSGGERWFLLDQVRTARYYGFAIPGDRLELTLEPLPVADASRRAWRGLSAVGGERRAEVEFEGVTLPLATLESRELVERSLRALRGQNVYRAQGGSRRGGA